MTSLNSIVSPAWRSFQSQSPVRIAPARDKSDYEQLVALMDTLLDEIGDDEQHQDIDLLDLVSQLVEDYESDHVLVVDAAPAEVLRHLIAVNGLTQANLKNELGSQSLVSAILNGHRQINLRQAKALASRFNVSPAVFV